MSKVPLVLSTNQPTATNAAVAPIQCLSDPLVKSLVKAEIVVQWVNGTRWGAMVTYGVDVVIPARNEDALLPEALQSVRAAIAAAECELRGDLPNVLRAATCYPGVYLARGQLDITVTVVADRCTDRTVEVARRWADRILEVDAGSPGQARRHGFADQRNRGGSVGRWLLSTDADSVVPECWIIEHLLHRSAGADVVAGEVAVTDWSGRPPTLRTLYEAEYSSRNDHTHGANLGLTDGAYRVVDGFRALATGEDQDIVDRCLELGFRVDWCASAPVITSARRAARAIDGFAAYLNELEAT